MIDKSRLLGLSLALLLALSGCTTMTAATTSGPINENYSERTVGTKVEDDSIETKVAHNLGTTDARLGDARINVDSYNGVVLLTGQVPSQELKNMAERIAGEVRNVRRVHNQLSVAANLPTSQRLTDTWLKTRIRTALVANEAIDSSKLRIVTENDSVFLMGIVRRQEAERIVAAVRNVGGMQRIVKVFDYLD
ncbi:MULTISPECIES: BON domain-containing protein [Halomonas]|uniref:BON domain-containing protein n=2 Tax=Halomonas TaxID=2745 RepID=A0ABQ0TZJ4_9GAMM|nr:MULTISPECIES: BON domain-containing protein [Halomonas]PSJ21512.1 BON domain-containing protein [Halomonas sp. ND22Bw]KGE79579.1 transporter [Halomonas salina]MDR5889540.1 BON domain-containing protein [Halomonas salina]RAH37103.1 BON domain-containing protein [Halomonas sp. SL1]WJY06222.1 BON domain-containing protein [Halomonas halophila]